MGKGVVDSIENAVNSDWLKKEKGKIKKHGVNFITNADFPPLLRELYDCPVGLYVLGALPRDPMSRSLGRMPSNYGKRMGREIAFDLAQEAFAS